MPLSLCSWGSTPKRTGVNFPEGERGGFPPFSLVTPHQSVGSVSYSFTRGHVDQSGGRGKAVGRAGRSARSSTWLRAAAPSCKAEGRAADLRSESAEWQGRRPRSRKTWLTRRARPKAVESQVVGGVARLKAAQHEVRRRAAAKPLEKPVLSERRRRGEAVARRERF